MNGALIGDVFTRITNGKNVRQKDIDGGIPITRIESIATGSLNPERCGYAGLERAGNENWILRSGDILMSHINSPDHVGKCALYTDDLPEMIHGMNLLRLEPDRSLLASSYAFHYFRTAIFRSQIRRFINQAVNQASISITNLKTAEIPLPPLNEQRRIAAILDEADALRVKRSQAISHLETLAQSIFHDMFGDPVSNAEGWDSAALPEIAQLYSGGTPAKNIASNWIGNLPWFSPKDLKAERLLDSIDHINEDVPQKSPLRLLPRRTVVFVVRGMILAHTFPVSLLEVPATINQDMKAVLPKIEVLPEFLLANIQSQSRTVLSNASSSAHGTKRLDASALEMIRVLLPPLALQQEYANRVATVEHLKRTHRTQLANLNMLFAALQNKAFKGELRRQE